MFVGEGLRGLPQVLEVDLTALVPRLLCLPRRGISGGEIGERQRHAFGDRVEVLTLSRSGADGLRLLDGPPEGLALSDQRLVTPPEVSMALCALTSAVGFDPPFVGRLDGLFCCCELLGSFRELRVGDVSDLCESSLAQPPGTVSPTAATTNNNAPATKGYPANRRGGTCVGMRSSMPPHAMRTIRTPAATRTPPTTATAGNTSSTE